MKREKINFWGLMVRLKVKSSWEAREKIEKILSKHQLKLTKITNFLQQKSSVAIKNSKSQFYRSKIKGKSFFIHPFHRL